MTDADYVEKLIKYKKVTDQHIVKKREKLAKMDEMLRNTDGGGVGGLSLASNSPDIILERLSLVKKFTIDNLITRMYKGDNNVKQIEDYDDETTEHLKRALKSGKDPQIIIQEQKQILDSRVKTYLTFASHLNDMFLAALLARMEQKT